MQQLFEKKLDLFDFFEGSDSHLLLLLDGEDRIINANAYALKFFGVSEEDLPVSLRRFSISSPEDRLFNEETAGEYGIYVNDHNGRTVYLKGLIKAKDKFKVAILRDGSLSKMRNDIFEGISRAIRSSALGKSFFETFSRAVADSFGVDVVLIGKYNEPKKSIKCPVLWNRSNYRNDVEYPIEHTPCENVISSGTEYFLDHELQETYPKDKDLQDLKVNTYFGMPLNDLNGEIIGHVAVMSEKNIPDKQLLSSVLSQFKDRLSFELDRIGYQARLEEVYDRFNFIAEKSSDIISLVEPQGSFIYVSPSSREIAGYEADKLIGKNAIDFIYPEDLKRFELSGGLRYFRKISQSHDLIQYRLLNEDGSYSWVESAISFSKGLYLVVTRDITERKEMEDAIRNQREFLRKIIDQAPNLISIKNKKGEYSLVNESMAKLIGLRPDEMIGRTDAQLPFDENKRQSFFNEDKKVFETGEAETTRMDEFKSDDGSVRYFQYIKQPLFDQNGKVDQILMVATDISHRVEAEAELQIAKDRAEELSKIKTNFLANMSHEIRTPINGILGLSELIEAEFDSVEGLKQYTGLLKESGQRLLNTIVSILDFSKLGSEKIEPELSNFDLVEFLKQYLPSMRVLADKKQLYLHSEYQQDQIEMRFDKRVLTLILNNLIGNAVKFTKKGGVTVTCSRLKVKQRNFVQIDITDTGIGISDDFMPKIFSPFIQESAGFNREYGGTGLGLSIVKRYIELFGGFIKVSSKKEQGSTFSIFLPLKPAL